MSYAIPIMWSKSLLDALVGNAEIIVIMNLQTEHPHQSPYVSKTKWKKCRCYFINLWIFWNTNILKFKTNEIYICMLETSNNKSLHPA